MSTAMNPVNNIRQQAHQGSVAAIIQVLNEELSDLGVRTRAVFDNGILQLLCEADIPEKLSEDILPRRVKEILDDISPRSIRRVNLNSRIVREQQLLWLDEINRDPDVLLWSREILLARPNLMKNFMEDMQLLSNKSASSGIQTPSMRKQREQQQFWRGILGGIGVALALFAIGGGIWWWLNGRNAATLATAPTTPTSPNAPLPPPPKQPPTSAILNSPDPVGSPVAAPAKPVGSPEPVADPFATAVRLAEEAAADGAKAKNPDDWSTIAEKWGKASELMAQVPSTSPRYSTAQDRTTRYKDNQTAALQKTQ
jgi:hypothetical protein